VHVGRATAALIYYSPVTAAKSSPTASCRQVANGPAPSAPGVRKGYRVLTTLPMIPEAVIAMLAFQLLLVRFIPWFSSLCAHDSPPVSDDSPEAGLTASCGHRTGAGGEVQALARPGYRAGHTQIPRCSSFHRWQSPVFDGQGPRPRLDRAVAAAAPQAALPLKATRPLYIRDTSA